MGQTITVVDAFTDTPYSGNPAAVCVLESPTTDAWMLAVAREMRHSETAFCVPLRDGRFELRWFTPGGEVRLCGHATLATAHVLWEEGRLELRRPAHFATLSGELVASPAGRKIELDFPVRPPSEAEAPDELFRALGTEPTWVGRDPDDYLVLLENEEAVRACAPDMAALRQVDTRGVIVTARSAREDVDFVSRFFAPRFGIDEDPVTGSAHCALTPFWAARLGKTEMKASQLSARGGTLEVALTGERVKLRGSCVTTLRGSLAESPPSADAARRPT